MEIFFTDRPTTFGIATLYTRTSTWVVWRNVLEKVLDDYNNYTENQQTAGNRQVCSRQMLTMLVLSRLWTLYSWIFKLFMKNRNYNITCNYYIVPFWKKSNILRIFFYLKIIPCMKICLFLLPLFVFWNSLFDSFRNLNHRLHNLLGVLVTHITTILTFSFP